MNFIIFVNVTIPMNLKLLMIYTILIILMIFKI